VLKFRKVEYFVELAKFLRNQQTAKNQFLTADRDGTEMKQVLGIVLAGGKGSRLEPLTRDRAKPAVPFGGHYRLIDFVLSNLVNGETSNGDWILGADKTQSGFFFEGLMDEIAIFDRALSAAEVSRHAAAAFIPAPAALPAGLALLVLGATRRRRRARLTASR